MLFAAQPTKHHQAVAAFISCLDSGVDTIYNTHMHTYMHTGKADAATLVQVADAWANIPYLTSNRTAVGFATCASTIWLS